MYETAFTLLTPVLTPGSLTNYVDLHFFFYQSTDLHPRAQGPRIIILEAPPVGLEPTTPTETNCLAVNTTALT